MDWFKDYLSERKQRVVINGQESEWGEISAGVPQGSVLGPLLFIVYINDLPQCVENNIRIFADDTSLFISFKNPQDASESLNRDLNSIHQWGKNGSSILIHQKQKAC